MEPVSPKGIRVRRHDHDTLQKDLSPEASDIEPEVLSDPIIQQQFRNFGYAIIQIGDRLVRVYGKPTEKPAKRVLGDATPGQQPEAYVGIQPGVDPRYEMSAWDNLERDRNKTKAVMRLVIAKSQPLDSDTKKKVNKVVRDVTLALIENRTRRRQEV
jgi:hypothetical protein